MESLEKLNAATTLAASKKDKVEKAMFSLFAEWKSLRDVDSSAQRLLQDCFTDIQSREQRLNAVQQSVTSRGKVLDERIEEFEGKKKRFVVMYEEKSKELKLGMKKFEFCKGFIDRKMKAFDSREDEIEEKKKLIEDVFEKFCLEMSEFEKIKGLVEGRLEEVKLMEKNIEDRGIELNRILVEFDEKLKNVVEKEKQLEVKEKSIENRESKLERISFELDVKLKNVVEKEKELELKERDIENQETKLNKDLVEFDVKTKNLMLKERDIENREIRLDKDLVEFDVKRKNVMVKDLELLELKERDIENQRNKLDRDLVEFNEKMKNVVEKEKELESKEKWYENRDIELEGALVEFDLMKKNVEEREREVKAKERSLEMRKTKLDRVEVERDEKMKNVVKKEKELEFRERRKYDEKRSKKVESRGRSGHVRSYDQDLSREYNCQKEDLNLEKKAVHKRVREIETKEKYLKEWVETIDLKEKEVDMKIVSNEDRSKELDIKEKELDDHLKESELIVKQMKEWVKNIDSKEKEINSVRILNEERCKKLDLMEKSIYDRLNVLIMQEQHLQDRGKGLEAKEKEIELFRISCEERCRKLELEKEKLEHQIQELEVKNKQLSKVDLSIVKPEPWSDDGSYADIRFSITMDGKNLLLYLINHKSDHTSSVTDEVYKALRLSMDPAKIVLNAMQDFYVIKEDEEFEEDVVCRSSILLLEQLRRISPHVQSYHKKAALELASKWKAKMKSSTEVVVFLQLLASYTLRSAFVPEEFSSLFEFISPQTQIAESLQLLGYTDIITDCIEAMIKEKKHVKAVSYVCAFGLRDKFPPATLLKDFLKDLLRNALEKEAIDNVVVSLHQALACIFRYNLESEYAPECIEIVIQQLVQKRNLEKVKLLASINDAEQQQDAAKNCKSYISSPEPTESCTTWLDHETDDMAVILGNMDGKSLQLFLNENVEDHGLICNYVFNSLKVSREPAKLVLDAIQGYFEMGDKQFKSPAFMRSCILLLEQLMKLSPEIKPEVKEDAMKLALEWKETTRTPLEILGFLHLITAYGLNSNFERSELEGFFETVSYLPHAPQLCRLVRFSEVTSNHAMVSSSNCHWHHKNSSGLKMQENTSSRASLIQSENSVKLVLDAMRSCYHSNLNSNRRVKLYVVKSFVNLMEKLLKTPQQVQPLVREAGLKFALEWKTRLVEERSKNPMEVLGFFYLLAICKVASSVDSDELLGLFDAIYVQRKAPDMVRLLGLEHKIPGFIKGLMKKDRLQAIRYIYEFNLVGKFRPVSILKDHICSHNLLSANTRWKRISDESQGKAISKQLASVKEVVKCIKDHQLEIEYPPHNLLARIKQLEELMPKKSGRKRHASGSDLRLEAQTQWHNRKHPRIEPLVGSSLNVPPAFLSMTDVIG
ncbi:FRIGIDA-like protein 5 [Daucus carota subsp. sativus]|uniref:FRIGIDA-like protein 5 n=1 Tax=Daucus carota subsp. sativus TaxID=79200 RepID=UPI003083943D